MATSSYFYVLLCRDGSLYGGYTTDLVRREQEHNQGVGAKYTRPRKRRPVKMIYAERYQTRSQATKAEYHFKKKTRPQKNQYLRDSNVDFKHLDTCIVRDCREEAHEDTKILPS